MNPWAGVGRLVVDGSNLLHRLARERGRPDAAPPVALTGRLRAAVPREIALTVFLDGPPDPGGPSALRSGGVEIRHSPRGGADAAILWSIRLGREAASTLLVTDDRDLARAARDLGARTVGTAWLIGRLTPRRAGASPAAGDATEADADERPVWRPGRGATAKRGNPRRAPRRGGRGPGTGRPA